MTYFKEPLLVSNTDFYYWANSWGYI